MKFKVKTFIKCITRAFQKSIDNFCAQTYIHAAQFLSSVSQPSCKLFDKIFWSLVVTTMLVFSVFACDMFLQRFNENGMKNYIETEQMSISFVPFPAITVCPTQLIMSSELDKIIQNKNLHSLNLTLLRKSLNSFDFNDFKYNRHISNKAEINVITNFMSASKLDTLELMKSVSYNCKELLVRCSWEGVIVGCEKLFKVSTSHEGFCCSFNYDDEHRINSTPIKTMYFGIKNGLSFALNIPNVSDAYTPSVYGSAVKILIHESQTYASFLVPKLIIGHNTENVVYLKPRMIRANDDVKALAIPIRNCYFKEEPTLQYFEVYSYENCIAECAMNRIYDLCSCVPHIFPSYTNLTVCDAVAIKCFQKNIDTVLHLKSRTENDEECHCLRTCNKLYYPYDLLTTQLTLPTYSIDPFYTNLNKSHTVVHVAMAKQNMRLSTIELSLTWIQLVANIGGIVSLFTGVSLVSCTHCLYFFTVKWILNIHNEYKREHIITKCVRFR